ncbi:MAG TPA: hypothetical protein VFM02_02730, partial [Candidatus Paceibacterota bacterium]|nr:hypothetical protein [Candidatus Paceibacterota bacterium]
FILLLFFCIIMRFVKKKNFDPTLSAILLASVLAVPAFLRFEVPNALADSQSSSYSSVSVDTSGSSNTVVKNGTVVQSGGQTTVHVETDVNGQKHVFDKVIHGAGSVRSVVESEGGVIHTETSTGTEQTEKDLSQIKAQLQQFLSKNDLHATGTANVPTQNLKNGHPANTSAVASTIRLLETPASSSVQNIIAMVGVQTGTSSEKAATSTAQAFPSVIISFIHNIFAYVSSFF